MRKPTLILAALALTHYAAQAEAYIGPGAGAGTIAVVFGVIASVFFALVGIVWYPLKRLWRGWRQKLNAKPEIPANME